MTEINQIQIFENERIDDLYPFNILHCGWELRTGALKQYERVAKYFPNASISYKGRPLHTNSFLERYGIETIEISNDSLLIIDSSILLSNDLINFLNNHLNSNQNTDLLFTFNSEKIIYYIHENSKKKIEENYLENPENFKIIELEKLLKINYLWDCLDNVGQFINEDSVDFEKNDTDFAGVYQLSKSNIFIGKNVEIMPNCVIDASGGSVIIDNDVTIMSQSTIIGPCYIGKNSTIKIGAKIYPNTSIGEFCKIGGEVENTIIHSFSNKQHEGFLGHSYICEWVNLGADTNNSDLKNTYSEIKMRLPHKTVKSGRIFLGLMCGDHTKTAINTQFNTGTVAGICGVLFESGFLSTTIPSFEWGGVSHKKYKFEEALDTAEKVMKRRNKTLTKSETILIRNEYNK